MALDTEINQLPAAIALDGSEFFPISLGDLITQKATIQQIADFIGGGQLLISAPINKQSLVYDNISGKFKNAFIVSDNITEGGVKLFYNQGRFDASFATKSTTDLAEGANLYWTTARGDARITIQKGAANGLATLDINSKVPVSQLPDSIVGATKFKGIWNANTNIITSSDVTLNGLPMPAASSGNEGYYFIVTTPGATNEDGIIDWKIGDWIISIGASWQKVDNTDAVITVNGLVGNVILTTSNISDTTDKRYQTDLQQTYNDATSSIQTQLNGKQATLGFTPENAANKDASGGYVGLTLFKIDFKNVANTFTSFLTNSNTAARTYTFQDRNGIIADSVDLAGKLTTPTLTTNIIPKWNGTTFVDSNNSDNGTITRLSTNNSSGNYASIALFVGSGLNGGIGFGSGGSGYSGITGTGATLSSYVYSDGSGSGSDSAIFNFVNEGFYGLQVLPRTAGERTVIQTTLRGLDYKAKGPLAHNLYSLNLAGSTQISRFAITGEIDSATAYFQNIVGLGINVTSPTALLHLAAGTATAGTAPIKFNSGTVLGTTEAGAIEYDGTHLYFTASNGGARYQLDQQTGGLVQSVSGTANRITSTGGVNPVIDISALYVGQSSITTLGTITTGVWNGTAIANANLANSAITINGSSTSLGGSATITTTGTASRITVSGGGGLTPTIDISATFEALLGKVASPLSQFAATTSAQLRGVLSDENGTGVALFDGSTSATFITPNLGTPSTLVGTNISGTASGLTAGNVTTNANLTGPITSVGNATSVASQTGTGNTFVMNTSPTLVTPEIGAATGQSLFLTKTTEQLRLAYDGSNSVSFTTSSSGSLTITPTGTGITLAASVVATTIKTNVTADNANFAVISASSSGTTTGATLQVLGASTTNARITMRGSSNPTPAANSNYSSIIVGQQAVNIAGSGTHALFAQQTIRALSITAGAGTLTNSATQYIEGAATGATNNYAQWIGSGIARFGGNVQLDDAVNIVGGTTTGFKVGDSTSTKISIWNKTPIIQPASANQAALTNNTAGTYDGTLEAMNDTTAPVLLSAAASLATVNQAIAAIRNNFTDVYTLLDAMRTAMVNFGSMKGAA